MQSCSSPLWRKMRSHWPIWRVEPPPVERPLPEYARHRSRAALRGVDRSVDSQHFVVVVRCLGAVEESTGWSSLPTALPPSRLRSPRCYIQVSPGNCRKFWTDETIDWWRGKCCSRHLGARWLPSFRCLRPRLSAGDSMGNLANCRENTRCIARSLVSGVNHSRRSRPATAGWNRHESASKLSAPTAIQGGDALADGTRSR